MDSSSQHHPSPFAVAGLIAALTVISAIIAGACAWAVVILWFANTRGDGLAAFEIAFLSSGLFITIVLNTFMLRQKPLAVIPAGLWIALAALTTYSICRDSFINGQNWRWILHTGDARSYELQWIIRGWTAIAIAAGSGLLAGLAIIRRSKRRELQLVENGNQ